MELLKINTVVSFTNLFAIAIYIIVGLVFILVCKKLFKSKDLPDGAKYSFNDHSVSAKPGNTPIEIKKDELSDVEWLSFTLKIPAWSAKMALHIPIVAVCTAAEATEAFEEGRAADYESDEEFVAYLKWIELEDDYQNLCDNQEFIEDYPYLRKLLFEKWDKLLLEKIASAASKEELQHIEYARYDHTVQAALIKKVLTFRE